MPKLKSSTVKAEVTDAELYMTQEEVVAQVSLESLVDAKAVLTSFPDGTNMFLSCLTSLRDLCRRMFSS